MPKSPEQFNIYSEKQAQKEAQKMQEKISDIDKACHSPEATKYDEKLQKWQEAKDSFAKSIESIYEKYPTGIPGEEYGRLWEKFKNDVRWEEMEKALGGDRETLAFLSSLAKNKSVGLDPDSLLKRSSELAQFYGNKSRRTAYIPDIAIIHTLLGENLSDRTIVEVGPGREGIAILAYFASRGAKTVAIDIVNNANDLLKKYQNVEFIEGAWEDIEEHMKERKADVIYTHNMHPNPEAGGKFNRRKKDFEKHTAEAMDRVLVPGGAYVGHHVESDYVLYLPEDFIKTKGYKINSFSSPFGEGGYKSVSEKVPERFKEPREADLLRKFEECRDKAPFYGFILVEQKPEK